MQATGKRNATATRINAVTGDAKKRSATVTKINASATKINVTATTLTSMPSSEVASSDAIAYSEMVASLEQTTTGLMAGKTDHAVII